MNSLHKVSHKPLLSVPPRPQVAPRALLVLLHGLGMRPELLAPFPSALQLPVCAAVPAGPVQLADGAHAWWPVDLAARAARLAPGGPGAVDLVDRDPPGRAAARAALSACLQPLRAEWPGLPLVLAGFSQGGMLALDHVLCGPEDQRPQALVLWSSSRIARDDWAGRWARVAGLPVQISHGRQDRDLAFSAGEGLREALLAGGAQVQWRPFEGGHEIPLLAWRGLRRLVMDLVTPPA